jgi:hypothetical protein
MVQLVSDWCGIALRVSACSSWVVRLGEGYEHLAEESSSAIVPHHEWSAQKTYFEATDVSPVHEESAPPTGSSGTDMPPTLASGSGVSVGDSSPGAATVQMCASGRVTRPASFAVLQTKDGVSSGNVPTGRLAR